MKAFRLFLLQLVLLFLNDSYGRQVGDLQASSSSSSSRRNVHASSTTTTTTTTTTTSLSSTDPKVFGKVSQAEQFNENNENNNRNSLRPRRSRRRLPGGADYGSYDFGSMDTAQAGFIGGILFLVLLFCLILCCCCGRCSLWDCVALACLWELCCDNDGAAASAVAGDFVMI